MTVIIVFIAVFMLLRFMPLNGYFSDDYSVDKPRWAEVTPCHFVLGNEKELRGYTAGLA